MRKTNSKQRLSLKALMVAVATVCAAGTAQAFKIDAGEDWDVQLDNTVQWTTGWRMQSIKSKIGNQPFFNEGDYKFAKKGDMVTNRVQDLIEFQGTYQNKMGFRTSASIWHDFAYNDNVKQNPAYVGVIPNSYAPVGSPVGTPGKYNNYVKHYFLEGGDWLDGFVFYNTQIFDKNVYAKVGRLAQYWGNAFFFGFSNIAYSQSPIDFGKVFTQPGSEIKELFLPRNQVLFTADITPDISITGEYFLEYRHNIYPEAGTYFGFFDVLFQGPATSGAFGALRNVGYKEPPNNNHNYGLKATWSPEWIGGDLGFYYRQLDEVDPWVGLGAGPGSEAGNWGSNFAQKTKLIGISFEKTFGSISTGWELNTRRHTALNSSPFLTGDLKGASGNITNLIGNTLIQLGTASIGDFKLWNSGLLLAEFSYTHLNNVTDNPTLYSGKGTSNGAGGFVCTRNFDGVHPGDEKDGCSTKNSLAVAILFVPQWQQVWAGVDLEAPISYTYGVHGNPAYRASAFFAEGTNIYSFGIRAIYQQKHQLTLSYNGNTWRSNGTAPGIPGTGVGPSYAGFGGAGAVGINDRGWVELQYKTSF